MMSDRETPKIVALQSNPTTDSQRNEELPYAIELWDEAVAKVERVIARAASAQLARTIFATAQKEFPDRRITLRRAGDPPGPDNT